MAIKTVGAEWNEYYNDATAWPFGTYLDEEVILVNGAYVEHADFDLSDLPIDVEVIIEYGYVYGPEIDGHITLEDHFKKWKESQNMEGMAIVALAIPVEMMEALRSAVEPLGAKIVRVKAPD